MSRGLEYLVFVLFLTPFASCNNCGERKVKRLSYLAVGIGTTNAYKGQWPWLASLFARMQKGQDKFICGATIISELTLLSGKKKFVQSQVSSHSIFFKKLLTAFILVDM